MVAMLSVALLGLSVLGISARMIPEPWDLMLAIPALYICPIAGLTAALSFVKHDLDRGVSKMQIALGALISIGLFVHGLWTIGHLRP
jgi:hypothetical protein